MRSKIRWFTEFCNSHYVSHFAAFFIVARAKISVVESCLWLYIATSSNIASEFGLSVVSTGVKSCQGATEQAAVPTQL